MFVDRIEGKWIDTFTRVFELCKVESGTRVALLAETQSRPINIQLAELALERLGANWCRVTVPTPRQSAPVPVRSTGASQALGGQESAIAALAASELVVDLTLEGLLHAAELPHVLADGARVLMVSNEHPDALERLLPDPELTAKVKLGLRKLKAAHVMQVTSPGPGGALAGRPLPLLPTTGQRARHAGARTGRREPDLQALRRDPGTARDPRRLHHGYRR